MSYSVEEINSALMLLVEFTQKSDQSLKIIFKKKQQIKGLITLLITVTTFALLFLVVYHHRWSFGYLAFVSIVVFILTISNIFIFALMSYRRELDIQVLEVRSSFVKLVKIENIARQIFAQKSDFSELKRYEMEIRMEDAKAIINKIKKIPLKVAREQKHSHRWDNDD